jgi:hypothetical protein
MFHQTLHVKKKQFYATVAQLTVGLISLGAYLFWAYFCTGNKGKNWNDTVAKLICIFGDYIVVLQYINLVLLSGQYFYQANLQLLKLEHFRSQKSTGRAEATVAFLSHADSTPSHMIKPPLRDHLSALVYRYDEVLDIVQRINSAYSLQISFNVAKIFVHITFCLYLVFVVTFSTEYDAQYIVHALFLCFWAVFQLVLIVVSCDYSKREVSMNCYSGSMSVKNNFRNIP